MPTPRRALRFDEEQFVLQTAIASHGLALMSSALVGDVVGRGLLEPFRPEVTLPGGQYTPLSLPERARARKIARFMDGLAAAFG